MNQPIKSELYNLDEAMKEKGSTILPLLADVIMQAMPELMLRGKSTFNVRIRDKQGNIREIYEVVITKKK